ncbi:hypothetical protein CTAYLR_009844 [Chrysophaeum taylorii]|uniref:Uncharacterized protein n=1 Tax=Chrysophaeum taylorii TaxID=2483200 RepID=A0AAD7XGY9_9STRA|nr:hypothetical protein CTAYLR_009844 [Chrysophaeum taylorii]
MDPEVAMRSRVIDKNETKDTLKAFDRRQREKQAWHNEKIYFEIQNENGEWTHRFRLPRRQCQPDELQRCVEQRDPFTISYLMNKQTHEVIHLEEAIGKCQPHNRYVLVPRQERDIFDAAGSDHYEGTLVLLMENVPDYDDRNEHKVEAIDLREWIMFGLQEEDNRVQRAVGFVGAVEEEIETLVKNMKLVPFMAILDAKGKPLPDNEADAEREIKYQELLAEKEVMEKRLEKAKHKAQEAIAARDRTRVVLTPAEGNTWYVSFDTQLEYWASNKTDWDGIKLAVGHVIGDEYLPPFAGRGSVPDGSKDYLPDYTPYVVNMQTVRFRRVEQGFGIFKALPSERKFEYYHGQFKEGKRQGAGVEYSDQGVYTGMFYRDQKRGGRMDFANGDTFVGALDAPSYLPSSKLRDNPYARGVFQGHGKMMFADGSVYEGSFTDGRITGEGRYVSEIETLEGSFEAGRLRRGKLRNVVEEYDGELQGGIYHGRGTLKTRISTYDGVFEHGLKWGRGIERYHDVKADSYEGFYILGERFGHGVLRYSKSKKYEGRWFLGLARTLGVLNSYFTYHKEDIASISRHEQRRHSRDMARWKKHRDLDREFRAEIIRRKCGVFRQQQAHAKSLTRRDEGPTAHATVAHRELRRLRLQELVEANKLSAKEAKRMATHNDFGDAVSRVNDAAQSDEERIVAQSNLSAAIQSEFEELEERWNTLQLEPCLDKARQNIVWREQKVKQELKPGALGDIIL